MTMFRQMRLVVCLLGILLANAICSYAQTSANENQPLKIYLPFIKQSSVTLPEVSIPTKPVQDSATNPTITTNTLAPTTYTTTSGSDGAQPISGLAVQDSPNTQKSADWPKYLELYTPDNQIYSGYRTYLLPSTINLTSIITLQAKINFKGPTKLTQTWIWSIYNWSNKQWITLGDNNTALSWQWTFFTFNAGGNLADYVNSSTRELRVRVQSNNIADDMDLDYEALIVGVSNSSTPAATLTPSRTPVSTSTFTSTPSRTPTPQPTATSTPSRTPTPNPTSTLAPGAWWHPIPGTSWQIQFQGTIDTSFNVQMYDVDLFDTNISVIQQLHQKGVKVVCYFSAGTWEKWRDDAKVFPAIVVGKSLPDWPNEKWLDIRSLDKLGPIMTARFDLAVKNGCDGIDPDNIDGYTQNSGFPINYQDQLKYNHWLADQAHQHHLAIGLKNDLEQIPDLITYFDFAFNEQCFDNFSDGSNECPLLLPFVQANKPVFGIEYDLNTDSFCKQANAWNFDFLKKEKDLTASRQPCR